MDAEQFSRLVNELRLLPAETSWVEYKKNNADPQMIGELVSALSNATALYGKETGWILWGLENSSRTLTGTTFVPSTSRKGNQDLESWLVQMLSPRLLIRFHCGQVNGRDIVVLEIPAASGQPTAFRGKELIRVGSTNRALRDVPHIEQELWRSFESMPFEKRIALADKSGEDVLKLLDCPSYFELLDLPQPDAHAKILAVLAEEDLIRKNDAAHWDITNLGATLFARDLARFPSVDRKAVRVIVYKGRDRLTTERELEGRKGGYAVGFENLMEFLNTLLPHNEIIESALRSEVPMYPLLALRELVANALIHQDFTISGTGPMVDVFENRIEITNPAFLWATLTACWISLHDHETRRWPLSCVGSVSAKNAEAASTRSCLKRNCTSFRHRDGKPAGPPFGPFCSLKRNSRIWTRQTACMPATFTRA